MTKLASLVILLGLTRLALGHQEEEEMECGGPQSVKAHVNMLNAVKYYSRCTYPTHNLNVRCILSSCPSLSGVCPLTSTGSVNLATLSRAVSILNACLGQNGLICGFNMTRAPLAQIAWTTSEFIPPEVANGTMTMSPKNAHLSNLSKAKITVPESVDPNGPITLTIDATDIISEGYCNCTFTIPSTSVLSKLTPLLVPVDLLNTPNVHGVIQLNLSSTVTLDLSTQPPTVNTHVDQFGIAAIFDNFIASSGVGLGDSLVTVFNEGMTLIFSKSIIPSSAATFLSTYAALGLQASQQNCTS